MLQFILPHLPSAYREVAVGTFEDFLRGKCPTLAAAIPLDSDSTVKLTRAVSGISLWKTAGTMADWKCLDRFEFDCLAGGWNFFNRNRLSSLERHSQQHHNHIIK